MTKDTFPPVKAARGRVLQLWPVEGMQADPEVWSWTDPGEMPLVATARRGRWRLAVYTDGWVAAPHPIGELITCDWCSSVWIAFGVVAARRLAPRLWGPVAAALACSEVAGLAARGG